MSNVKHNKGKRTRVITCLAGIFALLTASVSAFALSAPETCNSSNTQCKNWESYAMRLSTRLTNKEEKLTFARGRIEKLIGKVSSANAAIDNLESQIASSGGDFSSIVVQRALAKVDSGCKIYPFRTFPSSAVPDYTAPLLGMDGLYQYTLTNRTLRLDYDFPAGISVRCILASQFYQGDNHYQRSSEDWVNFTNAGGTNFGGSNEEKLATVSIENGVGYTQNNDGELEESQNYEVKTGVLFINNNFSIKNAHIHISPSGSSYLRADKLSSTGEGASLGQMNYSIDPTTKSMTAVTSLGESADDIAALENMVRKVIGLF